MQTSSPSCFFLSSWRHNAPQRGLPKFPPNCLNRRNEVQPLVLYPTTQQVWWESRPRWLVESFVTSAGKEQQTHRTLPQLPLVPLCCILLLLQPRQSMSLRALACVNSCVVLLATNVRPVTVCRARCHMKLVKKRHLKLISFGFSSTSSRFLFLLQCDKGSMSITVLLKASCDTF